MKETPTREEKGARKPAGREMEYSVHEVDHKVTEEKEVSRVAYSRVHELVRERENAQNEGSERQRVMRNVLQHVMHGRPNHASINNDATIYGEISMLAMGRCIKNERCRWRTITDH